MTHSFHDNPTLSKREKDVLDLLIQGMSNKQISFHTMYIRKNYRKTRYKYLPENWRSESSRSHSVGYDTWEWG